MVPAVTWVVHVIPPWRQVWWMGRCKRKRGGSGTTAAWSPTTPWKDVPTKRLPCQVHRCNWDPNGASTAHLPRAWVVAIVLDQLQHPIQTHVGLQRSYIVVARVFLAATIEATLATVSSAAPPSENPHRVRPPFQKETLIGRFPVRTRIASPIPST